MRAAIIGPDGRVRYRRPIDHIDVTEALIIPGYSVQLIEGETHGSTADGSCGFTIADLYALHNLPPPCPPREHP
jgi:hypothetical protein